MRLKEILVLAPQTGGALTVMEKRLSARERTEPESQARLRDEATLLRVLGGRVTPRLVDAGEDAQGPWLRTEKLAFPTLGQRIEARGGAPLDGEWLQRAALAAFAALGDLHDARDASGPLQIVHADVSPANLAIDDAGTYAVLLDLELASWREGRPRDGAFRGTARYCAPEIARGQTPTFASDLFALAAALLHASLGRAPREASSLAALLAMAAERPLLDEAHVRSAELLSRGPMHAALVHCLAHDAAARPRSAHDVVARLGECTKR